MEIHSGESKGGVVVVKVSLYLTGKYPNTNKGRVGFFDECKKDPLHLSIQKIAVSIAPLKPGSCKFKRL